ncbi:MAG: polysaccharide deacetylase family protein [Candidatus Marinimicrobia bacterium]|nr:polysaccharide deacetylase family protein [Candidatus Neomarinimicrobiota bacterium]
MNGRRTATPNRILNYHKVDTKKELGITVVHPKAFRKQVEFLVRKGYRLVTLSELFFSQDEKTIAICFDDGYQNVHRYAYPVLKQFNIPATVFIITSAIGKSNDWDANLLGIKFMHLDESEIAELIGAGWEIGSHGIGHRCLLNAPVQELEHDIGQSKEFLENKFQSQINFYSAPFGKINNRILQICQNSGYLGCCGFYPIKLLHRPCEENYVPRLGVYMGDTPQSVEKKLALDVQTLKWPVMKQNFINFCNNGTIIVKGIKEKLAL